MGGSVSSAYWSTGRTRVEVNLQPRMVRSRLMRRSAPQPRSRKTPRGGSTMAQMILIMSLRKVLAFVVVGMGVAGGFRNEVRIVGGE